MPCSTPFNKLTKTTQTRQLGDKTADVTQQQHYTSSYFPHTCKKEHLYPPPTCNPLTTPYHHHHQPLSGGLCGLFGVTLTPPRQVPPPIKETRIKAKDSLDIFRRRKRKNGNNYRDNATYKTPADEEEEEEDTAAAAAAMLWANWSYTMSPVSLLTHLANEFMVEEDASPCPSPSSMNIQRGRHPFCSRRTRMMESPAGRRVIDVQQEEEYSPSASSSQRNQSGSDCENTTSCWHLHPNASGTLAERWHSQGMDMSELARKKKETVDSDQSITDEYFKVFEVFENEQNDETREKDTNSNRPFRALPYPIQPKSSLLGPSQGLEQYKVVYDENKVIVPLTGSPEEWEWDRLLEEMENDDNKKR